MKTASWIILVVVGALTLLGSLVSLGRAYSSAGDQIGPASLAELSVGRPEVATAVRARRATAAAYAAGFATLFLAIALSVTSAAAQHVLQNGDFGTRGPRTLLRVGAFPIRIGLSTRTGAAYGSERNLRISRISRSP